MAVVFGECGRECLSAPGNTGAIANFYENSRIYSKVNVNHRSKADFVTNVSSPVCADTSVMESLKIRNKV